MLANILSCDCHITVTWQTTWSRKGLVWVTFLRFHRCSSLSWEGKNGANGASYLTTARRGGGWGSEEEEKRLKKERGRCRQRELLKYWYSHQGHTPNFCWSLLKISLNSSCVPQGVGRYLQNLQYSSYRQDNVWELGPCRSLFLANKLHLKHHLLSRNIY